MDGAAAPSATLDRVYLRSDGTLDELLGTVDEELPGFLPPADGTDGETAIAHSSVEMVVLGSFEAPRIVAGTGTDIGFLRRGADGSLEPGPAEAVPFALSIPVGADPTSLPVAVTAVGLPGSRILGPGIAQTFAERGIATISIDPFQNGSRAATATDERNELREIDGADGFAEHDGTNVVLRVQGGDGNGDETAFHPGFAEAASAQMVSDLAMLIRFLEEGDLSAIAGADAALDGLAFDGDALYWVGLSYGAVSGASAMALRPGIDAAVLNVSFGTTDLTACQGPANRAFGEQLASLILGIRGTFDEVERRLCMDPAFAFVNMLIEQFNPSNVVHYLFDAPLHDGPPPHTLFQQAGHDEGVGLATGESLLVAMGGPVGGDDVFEFAPLAPEAGPFADNRTTPNGTVTVAGWMFGGGGHEMLFRRQTERSWESPLRAPFTAREPPETVDNPTDDVHAQIAAFLASHLDGGPVTIAAP